LTLDKIVVEVYRAGGNHEVHEEGKFLLTMHYANGLWTVDPCMPALSQVRIRD
jgi:hypothetical protein